MAVENMSQKPDILSLRITGESDLAEEADAFIEIGDEKIYVVRAGSVYVSITNNYKVSFMDEEEVVKELAEMLINNLADYMNIYDTRLYSMVAETIFDRMKDEYPEMKEVVRRFWVISVDRKEIRGKIRKLRKALRERFDKMTADEIVYELYDDSRYITFSPKVRDGIKGALSSLGIKCEVETREEVDHRTVYRILFEKLWGVQ